MSGLASPPRSSSATAVGPAPTRRPRPARKPPAAVRRITETWLEPLSAVTRSSSPSPSRSAAAMPSGLRAAPASDRPPRERAVAVAEQDRDVVAERVGDRQVQACRRRRGQRPHERVRRRRPRRSSCPPPSPPRPLPRNTKTTSRVLARRDHVRGAVAVEVADHHGRRVVARDLRGCSGRASPRRRRGTPARGPIPVRPAATTTSMLPSRFMSAPATARGAGSRPVIGVRP